MLVALLINLLIITLRLTLYKEAIHTLLKARRISKTRATDTIVIFMRDRRLPATNNFGHRSDADAGHGHVREVVKRTMSEGRFCFGTLALMSIVVSLFIFNIFFQLQPVLSQPKFFPFPLWARCILLQRLCLQV